MRGRVLHLAPGLKANLAAAAIRAFPDECCGLIEGVDMDDGWRALELHETANLAPDPARRFLVDPSLQFALMRALRNSDKRIIGCYHSHPMGGAQPSETDRREAAEDEFVWLIAAGASRESLLLAAYAFEADGRRFRPLELKD